MKHSAILTVLLMATVIVVVGCSSKSKNDVDLGKTIKTVSVDSLTATLSSSTGQLKQGDQELTLSFMDASGKPVDVGAALLNFHMPAMGAMAAMNETAALTTTNTPGVYHGKVKISMAGEWQAQIAYEGPAGKGKTSFSVNAR